MILEIEFLPFHLSQMGECTQHILEIKSTLLKDAQYAKGSMKYAESTATKVKLSKKYV